MPLYAKNFVLSCNNTEPDVKLDHWEFNGYELQSTDREELSIRMDSANGSLIITNTRKQHEGNYTCVFSDRSSADIRVKGKDSAANRHSMLHVFPLQQQSQRSVSNQNCMSQARVH